jgi:uncharacterized protein
MTPQERQRIEKLFDRLATLEGRPRDPEAERAIAAGLTHAPHAIYPLVQAVLVQDEALRQADERIRALEESGAENAGFLDSMREALFGRDERQRRVPVPLVRQSAPMQPGTPLRPVPDHTGAPGGSFLGTAAATAAGVLGGALLLDSFRAMTGAHAAPSGVGDSGKDLPWSGANAADSDLARQAGRDDLCRSREDRQGWIDTAQHDMGDDDFDVGGDGGDLG